MRITRVEHFSGWISVMDLSSPLTSLYRPFGREVKNEVLYDYFVLQMFRDNISPITIQYCHGKNNEQSDFSQSRALQLPRKNC